jgi:uncharacterized protein
MKKLLAFAIWGFFMICTASAQDIAGDWQGVLKAGAAELRIVLHIIKGSDGTLTATFDSVDQGALGNRINTITFRDSKLVFSADSSQQKYEGALNANATAIEGNWSGGGASFPLVFRRQTASAKTVHKPAAPSDIDGTWMGSLDTGALKLRLVFHISNTEDGLIATCDSPDQNAKGLPVSAVARTGSSLTLEMKALAAKFEGAISQDLASIDGIFMQGGAKFTLLLKRIKNEAELERRRPQNPVKPYPYREEEVVYENKPAGFSLAATLTIPSGKGPFPAVVLITGSGLQDRDETILGHKPFLVLADYLTRKGIIVLRADDRGFGKSGGNPETATTADFATDAEAGVAFLKTRPEVDVHKIGLIGDSEGGIIAPMVAARNSDIAFIVMMAGPGVPGNEVLVEQVRMIAVAMGAGPSDVEKNVAAQREAMAVIKREKDTAKMEKELKEKLGIPEGQLKAIGSPWFRFFLDYDPATSLSKLKCRVLAINGDKDVQVSSKQNLPAIRKALEAGGNRNFDLVEFPGLNHLFQTAKTGAPTEYGEIEETISPVVLERIAGWILK